ncbi:MAG: MBL fold metallo-hydrolase [Muribaculum sp.]|nr:MBL fold metallo-hydrolase [Muribaculaceae bacterium]MCM1080768.1 MBL fold metallo-hydrolase [Muribaculum sp.]
MAKKISIDSLRQPSLFDDLDLFKTEQPAPEPIHPDIERMARKHAADSPSSPFGPVVVSPVPNKFMFMSMGSGSSGNCSYIGDARSGFLIDAGVDAATVTQTLKSHGIPMTHVKGICITHDHSDHMRYVYTLLRTNRHMKLYCTPRALQGMLRRHNISRRLKDYQVNIYKEIPFEIDNFKITAFEVMHDGTDNAGFYIQHDDRAITVATDLGCISPRVDYYMRLSDYLVIESNYDLNMLRFGPYPEYLKARIRACNGHMDNAETARYLAEIHTPRLRYVFLCHLSQDNNAPEVAVKESRTALEAKGLKIGNGAGTPSDMQADLQLIALPRFEASPLYIFRP